MKVLHQQNLQVGHIKIYTDDAGCWLEVHNGEEGVEALFGYKDLSALVVGFMAKFDAIRAAEKSDGEVS